MKVVYNFLPRVKSLKERGMEVIGQCFFCGMVEESTYHLFSSCSYIFSLLDKVEGLNIHNKGERKLVVWLRDEVENWNNETVEILVMVFYYIWFERNNRRMGMQEVPWEGIWLKSSNCWSEFKEVNKKLEVQKTHIPLKK